MEKQGKRMKNNENVRKMEGNLKKTRKLNEKTRKSQENETKTSPKRNPKKIPQTKKI